MVKSTLNITKPPSKGQHLVRKYRMYPTKDQDEKFMQHFGNVRFTYNYILNLAKTIYKNTKAKKGVTKDELNKSGWELYKYCKYLPLMKKDTNMSFLGLTNSLSLQGSLARLNKSFQGFFKGLTSFPQFKKKYKSKLSLTYIQGIELEIHAGRTFFPGTNKDIVVGIDKTIDEVIDKTTNEVISIPRNQPITKNCDIGYVRTNFHRSIPDPEQYNMKSGVVSKDKAGRYRVSVNFTKKGFETNEETGLEQEIRGKLPGMLNKGAKVKGIVITKKKVGDLFKLKLQSKNRDLELEFKSKFKQHSKTQLQILKDDNLTEKQLKSKTQKSINSFIDSFVNDIVSDTELFNLLKQETVGLDMGIRTVATLSDGTIIDNQKFLRKKMKKLKSMQRKQSRAQKVFLNKKGWKKFNKGQRYEQSTRYKKKSLAIAKQHAKISDARRDFAYKSAHKIMRNLVLEGKKVLFIEDLNVKGMMKNHKLAGAISDVAIGQFLTILKEVAKRYDIEVIAIGRFKPSTKMCSECKFVNQHVTLKDSTWTCTDCNHYHDNRDFSASKNMNRFGIIDVLTTYVIDLLPAKAKPDQGVTNLKANQKTGPTPDKKSISLPGGQGFLMLQA